MNLLSEKLNSSVEGKLDKIKALKVEKKLIE